MGIIAFFDLARKAIKEFPAAKWLFGVIGLIAVIALAKATTYPWYVFAFGAIGALLSGGMLAVAAAAYEKQKQQGGWPIHLAHSSGYALYSLQFGFSFSPGAFSLIGRSRRPNSSVLLQEPQMTRERSANKRLRH
jgi:hypothetical protein